MVATMAAARAESKAESSAANWAGDLAACSAGWMVDRKVDSMVAYWAVPMVAY